MRVQRKLMLLLIYIFDFYSDSVSMMKSALPFHALLMVQQFKALFVCASQDTSHHLLYLPILLTMCGSDLRKALSWYLQALSRLLHCKCNSDVDVFSNRKKRTAGNISVEQEEDYWIDLNTPLLGASSMGYG